MTSSAPLVQESDVIIESGLPAETEAVAEQIKDEGVGDIVVEDTKEVIQNQVVTLSPSKLAKEYEHINRGMVKDVIYAVRQQGVSEENKEAAVRKLLAEGNDVFGSLNTIESYTSELALQLRRSFFGYRKDRTAAKNLFPPTRPIGKTMHHCAVIIGICYAYNNRTTLTTSSYSLSHMKAMLLDKFRWKEEDIYVLSDIADEACCHTNHRSATRDDIIIAATQLVKNAADGDRLFFFFAGHGSRISSTSENDGFNEAILASDGLHITDDTLSNILCYSGLPSGVNLTCIFGSCHSGTVLDLKYNYKQHWNDRTLSIENIGGRISSSANIVCISACADDEYAWAASTSPIHGGRLTFALRIIFSRYIRRYYHILSELAVMLWQKPLGRYMQTPCISSSRPLDNEDKIVLDYYWGGERSDTD